MTPLFVSLEGQNWGKELGNIQKLEVKTQKRKARFGLPHARDLASDGLCWLAGSNRFSKPGRGPFKLAG